MKPNNFPLKSNLDGTEELYTQTGDIPAKFTLQSIKKFIGGVAGTNYILVSADGTPTENAEELQAAYDKAITLSPSITNRITILLANGYYDFPQNFEVTEDYIDLVSLDGNISIIFNGIGTIEITANDVFVKGINVLDKNFTIADDLDLLTIENCQGGDFSFGGVASGETEIIVSGRFINCQGGDLSFGGNGEATGYFKDCVGGDESFGYLDTSGTFVNCQGGDFSFGFAGVMNGTFENCTAGVGSFGSLGIIIDSEAKRCEAIAFAFGFQTVGIVDSVFDTCVAGLGSYGVDYDIVNEGRYYYCRLTEGQFQEPSLGGVVVLGIDGDNNIAILPSPMT